MRLYVTRWYVQKPSPLFLSVGPLFRGEGDVTAHTFFMNFVELTLQKAERELGSVAIN